jgi:F0F1-type ATP synthase assembly protein I
VPKEIAQQLRQKIGPELYNALGSGDENMWQTIKNELYYLSNKSTLIIGVVVGVAIGLIF